MIPRRPENFALRAPASFEQRRRWFVEQLVAQDPACAEALLLRLPGDVLPHALRSALREVVRRHEALRTRIVADDDGLWQEIGADVEVPLAFDDLTDRDASDAEAIAKAHVEGDLSAPLDYGTGPRFRARLLRLRADLHWLVLNVDRNILDEHSIGLLWRELSALYAAACDDRPCPLVTLSRQYADYAVWQRDFWQGERLAQQVAYWRGRLTDMTAVGLPTDWAPSAIAGGRAGRVNFTLEPALVLALRAIGLAQGATLSDTLLAAFALLLARYAGQTDVAVGMSVSGRTRPELDALIGCFADIVVLRFEFSATTPFDALLARVKASAREALAHQGLPFGKLVEELAPRGDVLASPFLGVTFAMVEKSAPRNGLRDVVLPGDGFERIANGAAEFLLSVCVRERHDDACDVKLDFAADRYDAATIERMGSHWRTLLREIAADPARRIGEYPLLSTAEREQLLSWGRGPTYACPADKTLAELFEAQASRSPSAIAVATDSISFDYDQLNRRANRLAHRLIACGVGPEVRVGAYLERSAELVVALLGILKAGGAYVPLDPAYPAARTAVMLNGCGPAVVITQLSLASRLPKCEAELVCIDDAAEAESVWPDTSPAPRATPTSLAYIIYTSGSTGEPKGGMIEQRSVVNHLAMMPRRLDLGATDRVLQSASIGFDQSIWQMVAPLLSGGCVVLPPLDAHGSASGLVDAIVRHDVTMLRMVPTLIRSMVDGPGFGRCRTLRLIISAGEVLSPALVREIHEQCDAAVENAYGPSEATFVTTYHRCDRDVPPGAFVPIGKPIANASLRLLDDRLEPVPIGVVGNIYIGGEGVGRGYLQQPALTAKAFVADPFSAAEHSRLYNTGDLARYRADGTIEFLGRRDHQVKLRGYRIELGEVEACVATCPGVKAVAVVLRHDADSDGQLAAYVVGERPDTMLPAAVRVHVAGRLPRFMVPATIVEIGAMPLLANGKVDRRQLASLPVAATPARATDRVTYSPVQERVAGLWAQVLRGERPRLDDDFFACGGDSLAATRLLSKLRNDFGVAVAIRDFFVSPTVAELAMRVSGSLAAPSARWPA
jgi:amino acid adenylation domain-containing protein